MGSRLAVVPLFAIVLALVIAGTTNAAENKVTLQNFVTSDEDVAESDVDLRVVLVHLETKKAVVVDVKAGQKKFAGNLTAGHWAVVMTRKVNNKPMYVGGGVAAVIFPNTLVALFNQGVDAANNDN